MEVETDSNQQVVADARKPFFGKFVGKPVVQAYAERPFGLLERVDIHARIELEAGDQVRNIAKFDDRKRHAEAERKRKQRVRREAVRINIYIIRNSWPQ